MATVHTAVRTSTEGFEALPELSPYKVPREILEVGIRKRFKVIRHGNVVIPTRRERQNPRSTSRFLDVYVDRRRSHASRSPAVPKRT
jgi:hypothetical protein